MNNKLDTYQIEAINKLILNLYNEEVPLHNRAIEFLNNLMSVVYFDKATILFYGKDRNGAYYKHSSISVNWEGLYEVVKSYSEKYCAYDDTLPVFDQPGNILFKSSTFFDQEERMKNLYWKEYLIPNNCIYSLEGNLKLKNNKGINGAFNFYRGGEKKDFTDTDVAIISLLQPHLSNVLKYYGEADDKSNIMFMLENHNCVGMVALDQNCRELRSNTAYKEIMDVPKVYKTISNRIASLCVSLAPNNNPEGLKSIECKFDEIPYFLEVSKVDGVLENDHVRYVCMIYKLSYFINQSLDHARKKYDLSPKEFDLLRAVLKGKSNEEISEEQFLSISTTKKYLASIYGKMGIKNQKQIFEKLNLQE